MLRKALTIVVLTLLLTGCSNPLPPSKSDYEGEWRSKEMTLLILADGTVAYKRLKSGGSVSVNGPIKEFQGDNFVVGFLFLTTTFVVTESPHEVDGKLQMVVDGVRLTRAR